LNSSKEDYETALVELINSKRTGKPITPKERPRGENVVDLMEALQRSVGGAAAETKAPEGDGQKAAQSGRRPEGNVDADRGKEAGEGGCCLKKPSTKQQRKSA
jgi:DNA end-binding protein Ku